MKAIQIAALGLAVLTAALSGCSKNTSEKANAQAETNSEREMKAHAPARTLFIAQPTLRTDRLLSEDGKMRLTVTVFAEDTEKTKVFYGFLGAYDQSTFDKGPGVDPHSAELLYVVSLDRDAGTVIAVHYMDGQGDSTGTAYVFKRANTSAPYELQWWLFGQTSKTATDLDTYMTEKGVPLHEALRALHADGASKTHRLDSSDHVSET